MINKVVQTFSVAHEPVPAGTPINMPFCHDVPAIDAPDDQALFILSDQRQVVQLGSIQLLPGYMYEFRGTWELDPGIAQLYPTGSANSWIDTNVRTQFEVQTDWTDRQKEANIMSARVDAGCLCSVQVSVDDPEKVGSLDNPACVTGAIPVYTAGERQMTPGYSTRDAVFTGDVVQIELPEGFQLIRFTLEKNRSCDTISFRIMSPMPTVVKDSVRTFVPCLRNLNFLRATATYSKGYLEANPGAGTTTDLIEAVYPLWSQTPVIDVSLRPPYKDRPQNGIEPWYEDECTWWNLGSQRTGYYFIDRVGQFTAMTAAVITAIVPLGISYAPTTGNQYAGSPGLTAATEPFIPTLQTYAANRDPSLTYGPSPTNKNMAISADCGINGNGGGNLVARPLISYATAAMPITSNAGLIGARYVFYDTPGSYILGAVAYGGCEGWSY